MVIKGPDGNLMDLNPDTGELLSAPVPLDGYGTNQLMATDSDQGGSLGDVAGMGATDGDQGGSLGGVAGQCSTDGDQGGPLGEVEGYRGVRLWDSDQGGSLGESSQYSHKRLSNSAHGERADSKGSYCADGSS